MAFGKDQRVLRSVGSFRQASAQAAKLPPRGNKGGGGGIPYFVDMYKPSTTQIDTIRLIAGEYLQEQVEGEVAEDGTDNRIVVPVIHPFIKFVDHFDGQKKKSCICSAGALANDKKRRKPCHGCDIYWATAERNSQGRFESNRMSRQNKYAFSVFDYSAYHKLPQIDKTTGQPKMNTQTNQPYFNWVKCHGQMCDACRAGIEKKQGNMSHWSINYTQLQVLRSSETDIGKSCTTCGTTDSITSLGWICANEGCGECAIDMGTTSLKFDELQKITEDPYQCASCGYNGFLTEIYECAVCATTGHPAVRASLFDVDLRVKAVEANNTMTLQVNGWSVPNQPPKELLELMKPVDLIARYAPDPLERQAAKFGVTVAPGTAVGAQAPAREYVNPYGTKA